MHIETFVISPIGSNCYVLSVEPTNCDAVIIDPGDTNVQPVMDYIDKNCLRVQAIWLTHGHFDHVMGLDILREHYGVPAYMQKDDLPILEEMPTVVKQWMGLDVKPLLHPDVFWSEGDEVKLGDESFVVWQTPGHSPGCVCLVSPNIVFTGDTLFAGTIGRTDFPLSSPPDMMTSLKRLVDLPQDAILYPGHGQTTTIERELKVNPFLQFKE